MIFYLDETIKQYLSPHASYFDQLMALPGECFREQNGRITKRIQLGEQFYFIKQHHGIGWRELLKNLLQARLPVCSAKNEWQANHALQQLGISVPKILGYGLRGKKPSRMHSFVLMEEVKHTCTLEDLMLTWRTSPPDFNCKRNFIKKVASIARLMHAANYTHRDFYLCHFLLRTMHHKNSPDICLIDLHRARKRICNKQRWIIKDLAGLYFSSLGGGLTARDYLRFIYYYEGAINLSKRWQKVKHKGEKLYRDHQS